MPKGPQGQKRPADAIGLAVMIGKIATGEIEDDTKPPTTRASVGSKGGLARAAKMGAPERAEVASKAAKARWQARAVPSEEEAS